MRKATTISARRACRLVGLSRTVLEYEPKADPSNAVLEQLLIELAHERRRLGYRRLHALVRREGVLVNPGRVWRLYQKAGLAARRHRRRLRIRCGRWTS
jgi:putative transposase